MILMAHITVALASVAYSTYLYFYPAPSKFKPAYYLLGITIASGTYLVLSLGSHLVQACINGLLYIGVVSALIIAAKHRLADEQKKID